MGGARNTYGIIENIHSLVGKAECKKALKKPRRRWKFYMITDVSEMDWDVDLMHLVHGIEPLGSTNWSCFCSGQSLVKRNAVWLISR